MKVIPMNDGSLFSIKTGQYLTSIRSISLVKSSKQFSIYMINEESKGQQKGQLEPSNIKSFEENGAIDRANERATSKEYKEYKEYIYTIFEFWNSKIIIHHRKLTDRIKRKISGSM